MKILRGFCNGLQKLPARRRGVCVFKKGFAFRREPNEVTLDGFAFTTSAHRQNPRGRGAPAPRP